AAWVRDAPRDVVTNNLEERQLFMIVIDDANMPRDPRLLERAKGIAADVVSRLGSESRAAVVFTTASKKAQPFTNDHARLLAAIKETGGGLTGFYDGRQGMETAAELDLYYAVGAAVTLSQSMESLLTAPMSRKTLVMISGGVPLDPSSRLSSQSISSDMTRRIMDELNSTFDRAALAHVNIYSFDANDDVADLNPKMKLGRDFLRTVATNTGGRAFIGADDPKQGVARMFREVNTYYLFGFSSASGEPGRHKVEITTSVPGARVQGRSTFEIARAEKLIKKPAPSPLAKAISGALPEDTLPMRVTATALPPLPNKDSVVAIVLGINQPTENFEGTERITAQINAYETTGRLAGSTKLDAKLTLRQSTSGRAQYDLLGTLTLRPGRYQLRIAAHSPRLNLRGSVFADLDVPDFSDAKLSMAPLILSMSPTPTAAPASAFAAVLPVTPTTHRTFSVADHVSVLARIYQGGRKPLEPVTVEVRVVNATNRVMMSRTETVPSSAPGRTVDYTIDLPVSTLPLDDYLVTVTARTTAGTSAQTLRFSRR
ncbi:MAG: hypothetical protein KA205_09255, partial [Acidobacteria bacterium]|nr:hypothetical protein [Acidobacteriota bacterium]